MSTKKTQEKSKQDVKTSGWKPSKTVDSIKQKKVTQDQFNDMRLNSNCAMLDLTGLRLLFPGEPGYFGKRFDGCIFDFADLSDVKFHDCRFFNCVFTGTRFEDTLFDECYFVRARFVQCDFLSSTFSDCDFRRAKFYECDADSSCFMNCCYDDTTEIIDSDTVEFVEVSDGELLRLAGEQMVAKAVDTVVDSAVDTGLKVMAEIVDKYKPQEESND